MYRAVVGQMRPCDENCVKTAGISIMPILSFRRNGRKAEKALPNDPWIGWRSVSEDAHKLANTLSICLCSLVLKPTQPQPSRPNY